MFTCNTNNYILCFGLNFILIVMHTLYDDLNFSQINLILISIAHFLTYHLLFNIIFYFNCHAYIIR